MKYLCLLAVLLFSTACSKPVVQQPVQAISQNMVACPKCGAAIILPPKETSLATKIFG